MKKTQAILRRASKILDKAFKKEVKDQGHSLTGALEASIEGKVLETSVKCEVLDYAGIINDGTTKERIPFRSGSGAKTSKYIDGLKNFFKLRGLSDKEAERAAFATAMVQKREGMSTAASKRYSKNGRRQNFIDQVIEAKEPEIDRLIIAGIEDIFESEYTKQKSETI